MGVGREEGAKDKRCVGKRNTSRKQRAFREAKENEIIILKTIALEIK